MGFVVERLHVAEAGLEREIKDRRRRWHSRSHRARVWFDRELREMHRRLRPSIPAYVLEGNVLNLLTAPVRTAATTFSSTTATRTVIDVTSCPCVTRCDLPCLDRIGTNHRTAMSQRDRDVILTSIRMVSIALMESFPQAERVLTFQTGGSNGEGIDEA
jgi:hypothetical protein